MTQAERFERAAARFDEVIAKERYQHASAYHRAVEAAAWRVLAVAAEDSGMTVEQVRSRIGTHYDAVVQVTLNVLSANGDLRRVLP